MSKANKYWDIAASLLVCIVLLMILVTILTGCSQTEPHVATIKAKAKDCEVTVELVIQKKDDLTIIKGY